MAITENLPPTALGTPKSVITSVKTTKQALMSPYFTPGSVTVRKVFRREAPSARGRIVEARVGGGEGGHEDQHGVGEAVEDLGQHDALGAVDAHVDAGRRVNIPLLPKA